MAEYNIHLDWKRDKNDFDYKTYNRKHTVFFYGGPKLELNSAPGFHRNPQFHSPEELLIASLSSCFLLTFLSLACKQGFIINSYTDNATCTLALIEENKQAVTEINLRPVVSFSKETRPNKTVMKELFKKTHELCFVANSLKSEVTVSPEFAPEEERKA